MTRGMVASFTVTGNKREKKVRGRRDAKEGTGYSSLKFRGEVRAGNTSRKPAFRFSSLRS